MPWQSAGFLPLNLQPSSGSGNILKSNQCQLNLKNIQKSITLPLPQHHLNFQELVWSQNLRLAGMLRQHPSLADPRQTIAEGGEGLSKSPLLVSIITFYLTSTRFWYLAAFNQVYYTISNFSIVQPVQAKNNNNKKKKETKRPTVPSTCL